MRTITEQELVDRERILKTMSKSKYAELDRRILACISAGKSTPAHFVEECSCAAWRASRMDQPAWSTIERRLQALRKAGKIAYCLGGWKIVEDAK